MLKDKLAQAILDTLHKVFPDHTGKDIIVEYPGDPTHGDYSCNIALQLSKAVQKPPREVAEIIVENFEKPEFIQTVEIAGPGFLNFFVAPDYLIGNLRAVLDAGDEYGKNKSGEEKKILIELSSPNTNKPLHLGHGRNNFLGMSVTHLLRANGYEIETTQIVNDRGIHICKSMLAYQMFGRDTSPESVGQKGDHFVGDYYVKYSEAFRKDASLEEKVREMLKKWEKKNPEIRALWEKMNGWVWAGFTETYETIGSHFTYSTFESDVSEGGRAIVKKALKEGKAEEIEGGAIAIDLSDCGLGGSETGKKVLVRSDGTTIYMTQDLQLAVKNMEGTGVDETIYVVGNEQDYHFKVLFEVLKRFGYDWAKNLHHLSYAMVALPSGKMKSREGTSVDLDNLIDDLKKLVDAEITKRDMPYEGDERQKLIHAVALGALKYFILKVDSKSDMMYDPESAIDFQGNTGPYLQYTHARIHSILRRTQEANALLNAPVEAAHLSTPEEISLLRKIQLYPEIIQGSAQEYRIHQIANTLFELAQLTNNFYAKHKVLEAKTPEQRTARLQLIAAVAQVLKNGLAILGIEAPERM